MLAGGLHLNWSKPVEEPIKYHQRDPNQSMAKLSLNKAAKYAGVAKTTIIYALKTNDLERKLSGERNARGHWEIETSELDRVFSKSGSVKGIEPLLSSRKEPDETVSDSVLAIEVKMLREQIERMDAERERERKQLLERIEDLKAQSERQSAEHKQALALLTDQRDKPTERPRTVLTWRERISGRFLR